MRQLEGAADCTSLRPMRTKRAAAPHRLLRQTRPLPAAAAVFQALREDILSLKLAPGSDLSRSDLQRRFGVSSTPVRDALMKLEEIGLVDVYPQSRTTVSLIDVARARHAQFLRRSVELEVVHTLASAGNPVLVRALRGIVTAQRRFAAAGDFARFDEADLKFHQTMYGAAGAGELWDLVKRQSVHLDRIRRLHLPLAGKAAQIVQEHAKIVSAIARREPLRAQAHLREHLSKSLAFSDELRLRAPAYFRPVDADQLEPSGADILRPRA